MEAVISLLIPIFSVLGLFTAISLNVYFKYKTNTVMSERVPIEALGEWYRSNAQSRAMRARGAGLRWGGFLVGLGLGTTIGLMILVCGGFSTSAAQQFDNDAVATFMIIALAILCGGGGIIGAYFLERRLDGKSPTK